MAAQPIFNNNCASCHKNAMSSADPNALCENNAPSTDTLALGGMLYSGTYCIGTGNGMSGNVLLAFAPQ